MREIKYRAWDRIEGRMRYDVTGFEHGKKNEMAGILLDGVYFSLKEDAYSLEYTGLKDKNGVEIYEGDILHFKDGNRDSWLAHIVFDSGHFLMNDGVAMLHDVRNSDEGEVIGNIYEHPELLK